MAAARSSPSQPGSFNFNTLDTSGRFAVDKLLRDNGFVIVARPRKGEAIWRGPDGKELPYSKVLKRLNRNLVEDAKYAQTLYLETKYK